MSAWTPQQLAILRRMMRAKATSSEVARVTGMSRSQCLWKARQEGLPCLSHERPWDPELRRPAPLPFDPEGRLQ